MVSGKRARTRLHWLLRSLLLALFSLTASHFSLPAQNPSSKWLTIRTSHFFVHFTPPTARFEHDQHTTLLFRFDGNLKDDTGKLEGQVVEKKK